MWVEKEDCVGWGFKHYFLEVEYFRGKIVNVRYELIISYFRTCSLKVFTAYTALTCFCHLILPFHHPYTMHHESYTTAANFLQYMSLFSISNVIFGLT